MSGKKRHIAVDIDGRLLMVDPTMVGVSDSGSAQQAVSGIRTR